MTPASATSPYCTPEQFLRWCDARTTGDLVRDDTTRATPTELLTDLVLLQFLQEASGRLESACFMGNRYSVDDLQALQEPVNGLLTNSAVMLAGIVAGVAAGELARRRPGVDIPESMKAKIDEGEKALELLSEGERILSFEQTARAGKMDEVYDSPMNVYQRYGVTVQCQRLFGLRGNRYLSARYPTINDVTG